MIVHIRRSAVFALMLVVCGCDADRRGAGHGLVIEPAALELTAGSQQDRQREVSCRLTNDSPEPIKVVSVGTSCACTMAAPLERTLLEPGESVSLRLKVSLPLFGRKESTVTVVADRPSMVEPVLRLILRGPERPVSYVELLPQDIWLTGYVAGDSAERDCEITTMEAPGSEPWLSGLSTTEEGIEVQSAGPPAETQIGDLVRRVYHYRVTGRLPQSPDAPEYFSLTLDTVDNTQNESAVPIRGKLVLNAVARVVPNEITIHRSELANGPARRTVLVVGAEAQRVSIAAPTTLPDWFVIRPAESDASSQTRTFEVDVSNPPRSDAAELSEIVRFGIQSKEHGSGTTNLLLPVVP